MQEANRLKRLPPYLFTVVDAIKHEVCEDGVDVIDLSMGNPDLQPPAFATRALIDSLKDPETHRYSKFDGKVEVKLRQSISDWYKERFNVDLDPATEVLPCIGSKEGIAHLSTTFLNNDDIALVPSPGYPVHFNGVIMAGGILYNLPLREENEYVPDIFNLNKETLRLSKLMFLSYPNNPTGAVVEKSFYNEVVKWAKDKKIMVCSDLAYSEIVYGNKKKYAPSILEAKGAKDFCIEFHSLSKTFSMAGWRLGFCVGNRNVLASLAKCKSYVDFGIFRGLQWAAYKALSGKHTYTDNLVKTYKKRIDLFCNGLNKVGWKVKKPKATFYVWAHIPMKYSGLTSMEFCELLLREVGVACSPGTGFGEFGEGYVRFAMVQPEARLTKAVARIKKLLDIQA